LSSGRIDGTQIDVKMDGEKERSVSFDAAKMRHFDHGYAVTSHSSQGLTADRVLVNMDTTVHPELINTRFAYVSVSRASQDARIYTNDVGTLGERLSTDVTKTSAIDLHKAPVKQAANQQSTEPPMTNSREHSQDDLRREPSSEAMVSIPEIVNAAADTENRRYAPIEKALPNETSGYDWKRETGDIESYKHDQTGGWLHIDPQSQFYDRQAQPITRENALEYAAHELSHAVADSSTVQSINNSDKNSDQAISL
jgi:UvrD-like helicase C-terminal domain